MTFNASTPLSFILILNGHWISKGSPCQAAGGKRDTRSESFLIWYPIGFFFLSSLADLRLHLEHTHKDKMYFFWVGLRFKYVTPVRERETTRYLIRWQLKFPTMKMFVLVVLVVCNPNELCVVHPLASVTDTPVGSWLLVVSRGCTVKANGFTTHKSVDTLRCTPCGNAESWNNRKIWETLFFLASIFWVEAFWYPPNGENDVWWGRLTNLLFHLLSFSSPWPLSRVQEFSLETQIEKKEKRKRPFSLGSLQL